MITARLFLAALFTAFVLVLASLAHAGCQEICREWPRPDYTQVNAHCCCEQNVEVACYQCGVGCQPTGALQCACPTPICAEPTPTPLPTPDSHAKADCCKQAILIYREAKRAALSRYHAEVYLAASRKREQRRMCQDGDEHGE